MIYIIVDTWLGRHISAEYGIGRSISANNGFGKRWLLMEAKTCIDTDGSGMEATTV
jgi:hypothetical protein